MFRITLTIFDQQQTFVFLNVKPVLSAAFAAFSVPVSESRMSVLPSDRRFVDPPADFSDRGTPRFDEDPRPEPERADLGVFADALDPDLPDLADLPPGVLGGSAAIVLAASLC